MMTQYSRNIMLSCFPLICLPFHSGVCCEHDRCFANYTEPNTSTTSGLFLLLRAELATFKNYPLIHRGCIKGTGVWYSAARNNIAVLEGSWASPARPSVTSSVKMSTGQCWNDAAGWGGNRSTQRKSCPGVILSTTRTSL